MSAVLNAAARITANSITHALRGRWHVDGFDANGNRASMTSPFRLTASAVKAPSLLIERFVWGVTDPDDALHLPALAWLLTEHRMLAALAKFPAAQRAEWFDFLNHNERLPPLPFRRWPNRHGTFTMRRTLYASAGIAEVAVAIAHAATVTGLADRTYRDAFPVELWKKPQGVTELCAKITTVNACP